VWLRNLKKQKSLNYGQKHLFTSGTTNTTHSSGLEVSMSELKKIKKKKGPIRLEAIIPVLILSALTGAYFSWFFDHHLKKAFEYVGTMANGAEVNVGNVRTSFIKGSFDLDQLEVTNKENPINNLVAIENIHFSYLWDALLRMKFVVEEASINQIKIHSKRSSAGYIVPPKPATPSKIDQIQSEVVGQVKADFAQNMLGDVISLLEGTDLNQQVGQIREQLKSEARLNEMIQEIETKKTQWDADVTKLTDTSKIKEAEKMIQEIKAIKDPIKKVQQIGALSKVLNEIKAQTKEIKSKSKVLESEIKAVTKYPKEIESIVQDDISSLKNRFKIPQIDLKDMAMALFAKEMGDYLSDARKYQALAKQYLPEKSEREEIVPSPRSEGETIEFPITKSYPIFWLKKAAISSKGTADSFSGELSGELTNLTTSPKWVKKPTVLDVQGDFPGQNVFGVKAIVTADFTKDVSEQMLNLTVNSFLIPEKLFSTSESLVFGLKNAKGSSNVVAKMREGFVNLNWNGTISRPEWIVDTKSKAAKELLTGIVDGIPVVYINGKAQGAWKQLKISMESNLGTEISNGLQKQIGVKIKEAESKIQGIVDSKIKGPQSQLMAQISGSSKSLNQINSASDLFKSNEDKIQKEISNLQKGGTNQLKEQGKKLFKGLKL
jgi:uncharacterized protein (TIGR03545 family)